MPLTDTDPETAAEQIRLVRDAPVSKRFETVRSLTASAIWLSRRAVARANPGASTEEIALEWVGLHYGPELEEELRAHLRDRRKT